jgi:hypothetical protein
MWNLPLEKVNGHTGKHGIKRGETNIVETSDM